LWLLAVTTQMPYRTFGSAQAGTFITVTRPRTVLASVA
jgi:hypothetical protein